MFQKINYASGLLFSQMQKHEPNYLTLTMKDKDKNIKPKVVNVNRWLLFSREDECLYAIGNIEIDAYVAVPASKVEIVEHILSFFDGSHTIEEIENHIYNTKNIKVDVYSIYEKFSRRGLVIDPKPKRIERGEFRDHSVEIVSFGLNRLYKLFNFINEKWNVILIVAGSIIATGLLLFFLNFEAIFRESTYTLFDSHLLGMLLLFPFMVISVLFHEISHAIAASKYRLKAKRLVIGLYFWIPIVYTEIPGIYTVKENYRIKIWLAGIYTNLFIFSFICIFLFLPFDIPALWDQILWKVAIANLLTAISNLILFLPTDGYFIITTILKTPNIRTNAFKSLKKGAITPKTRNVLFVFLLFIILCLILCTFITITWGYNILLEIYTYLPFDKYVNIFIIFLLVILPSSFVLFEYWKKFKLSKNEKV